jgi:hypothetical protein
MANRIARFQPYGEPSNPLFRGPVGEILWNDPTGRASLDRVIAYRHGRLDALLDVPSLENIKLTLSMVGPHPSKVIRLKLQFDRKPVLGLL